MADVSPIPARLATARKDLLDLSLRNRLINTPRGAGRSSRLEIVGERSDEVFRRLVGEQKSMSFLPEEEIAVQPAPSEAPGETALAQPADEAQPALTEPAVAEYPTDNRLQTCLTSERLQKALLNLFYDARTYEEEQGVNILYLATGFLKWFEDDSSTKERFAPLILIPVSLTRRTAGTRFKIAWTQEEIITNLSLQEKLKHEFGIPLPDLPATGDGNSSAHEEFEPSAYFAEVAKAVAARSRWEVLADDIVLWFFSFSKFLMYRDLDPQVWPADRPLDAHPLVSSILGNGFRNQPPICGSAENIDRMLPPADTIHVMDADSSQAIVIEEIRRGSNLVIQGPPGTGKSQTITNSIAAAVKDGKLVLFVAEKMAALEVVKRRLDNIGLGDMCLELHSHKANKRAVLEELKRTMALGDREPTLEGVAQQAARLLEARSKLNRHAEVLHTPLEPSGVTAFRAIGELVRLRAANTAPPKFELPHALEWTTAEFERKANLVRDVAHHVDRLGDPSAHPWRGVRAQGILPNDVTKLVSALPPIQQALARLREAAASLAGELSAPLPETPLELAELAKVAQHAIAAPPVDRSSMASAAWQDARSQIDALIAHGQTLADVRQKLSGVVAEAAWTADVAETRRHLKAYGSSWFRWFYKNYRAASANLAGLLVDEPPTALAERIELLDDLMRGQQAQRALADDAQGDNLGAAAFGSHWHGADSEWPALAAISDWERDGRESQKLLAGFRQMTAAAGDVGKLAAPLSAVKQHLKPMLQALAEALAPFELDVQSAFAAAGLQAIPLQNIDARLEAWTNHPEALAAWSAYFIRLQSLETEGLGELAALLDSGELSPADAVAQLTLAFYTALLREAFRRFPELASFNGLSHEQILARFKALDVERLHLARQEVAHAQYRRIPQFAGDAGELGVITKEINKKRNHLPIRQLLNKGGHAVQAIKPVFMMSPISVAQYLEPGVLSFDLLLIDEASQIEPVDALGAVARAGQFTVVGDDRQLPPTQFFTKLLGDDDFIDDEESPQTADIESILGLCRAQGLRDAMLRWHYRSRHHSLIAVSNHEFYDDGLFVIPSPEQVSENLGLRFRFVENGIFDRGKSRTNRIEAAAVADAVIDHARRCPRKTLGVGAFSIAQRDAILDELELRRRQHPELEPFFITDTAEPFFVKNLENIQGDERDVVFISVGYAKDSSGFMSMNFGPLSNDGGHRRLNVLISRAKERCEVFSSIVADDIDLNRGRSWGVKALKSFLRYAQFGELDVAVRTDREHDSEFEREVARALQSLGYEVHPQVGLAGFFIDLAVVDPETPGRYVLGIECDGASYHSSRSARDRDRLRQQVLEDRGWIIHRVWSTDWLNQPETQLRQVVAAIAQAKVEWASRSTSDDDCIEPAPPSRPVEIRRHDGAPNIAPGDDGPLAAPYAEASFRVDTSRQIHELPTTELAAVVSRIVEIEGPIHQEEVARRIVALWDLQRTGSRITGAIDRALAEAALRGVIQKTGPFVSPAGQEEPPVRDRSNVSSAALHKPEYLPPAEIRAAVRQIVRSHFGMTLDEAVSEVARLFGFGRTGPQLRQVLAEEIELMIAEHALTRRNEKLYVVTAENGEPNESLSAG